MFHASLHHNEHTRTLDRRGCSRQHSWLVAAESWRRRNSRRLPSRVEAPAEAAGQPSRPQANWIVSCSQTRPGLECRAGQSLFLRQSRQRVLSVAVRMPADTKKPVLLLQLPLGVYLPAGASSRLARGKPRHFRSWVATAPAVSRSTRSLMESSMPLQKARILRSPLRPCRKSHSALRCRLLASPRPTRRSSNSAR